MRGISFGRMKLHLHLSSELPQTWKIYEKAHLCCPGRSKTFYVDFSFNLSQSSLFLHVCDYFWLSDRMRVAIIIHGVIPNPKATNELQVTVDEINYAIMGYLSRASLRSSALSSLLG